MSSHAHAHSYRATSSQRANLFLEVFGNTLVQERTQNYIGHLGRELVELACNMPNCALEGIVDLDLLKYRDRDALVDVFRSWAPSNPYDGLRHGRVVSCPPIPTPRLPPAAAASRDR